MSYDKITIDQYWSKEWHISGKNLYLIIDMIHYENTRQGMNAYFQNRTAFFKETISLFKGTIDEDLKEVAPYLCSDNFSHEAITTEDRAFLETEEQNIHSLIWLSSDMNINELHTHLQHFLSAKLKNGREALLRFYDPRVVPTFLNMLKAEQAEAFWKEIDQIALWGREEKQRIIYRREKHA